MVALEICLVLIGIVIMIGSFFVTEKLSKKELDEISEMSQKEIKLIVDKELNQATDTAKVKLEDELSEIVDRLERESDKETNLKIQNISEYSDTVLEDINKTHNEVMFLYNMLGDKHKELVAFSNELQKKADKIQSDMNHLEELHRKQREKEAAEREAKALQEKAKAADEEKVMQDIIKAEEILAASKNLKPKHTVVDSDAKLQTEEELNNAQILRLHRQGMRDVDIAKELGLGLGVVSLVIGLHE